MDNNSNRVRTKPIESKNPHNSLEVIWNHDQTKILIDRRKKD